MHAQTREHKKHTGMIQNPREEMQECTETPQQAANKSITHNNDKIQTDQIREYDSYAVEDDTFNFK